MKDAVWIGILAVCTAPVALPLMLAVALVALYLFAACLLVVGSLLFTGLLTSVLSVVLHGPTAPGSTSAPKSTAGIRGGGHGEAGENAAESVQPGGDQPEFEPEVFRDGTETTELELATDRGIDEYQVDIRTRYGDDARRHPHISLSLCLVCHPSSAALQLSRVTR